MLARGDLAVRRIEVNGNEWTEDEASDRLRCRASSSRKMVDVQLGTATRRQGDTAQGNDTMSRNAETLEGARAEGGTRKEGRTKSNARTD